LFTESELPFKVDVLDWIELNLGGNYDEHNEATVFKESLSESETPVPS